MDEWSLRVLCFLRKFPLFATKTFSLCSLCEKIVRGQNVSFAIWKEMRKMFGVGDRFRQKKGVGEGYNGNPLDKLGVSGAFVLFGRWRGGFVCAAMRRRFFYQGFVGAW